MLKNQKRWGILAVCVFAIMFSTRCSTDPSNPKNVAKTQVITTVVNYRNGVYFFPYTGAGFGNALSTFIETHKNLEFVSFSEEQFGGTVGWFVVFKGKEK